MVPVIESQEVAVAIPDVTSPCVCARNGKPDAVAFICKKYLLDKILLRAVFTALFSSMNFDKKNKSLLP
jgi:hypothetical protein